MKTLTAKKQNLSLEENIHSALKREFLYAESVVDGDTYLVGNRKREIQVLWTKNICCEYVLRTNEGNAYLMFTVR